MSKHEEFELSIISFDDNGGVKLKLESEFDIITLSMNKSQCKQLVSGLISGMGINRCDLVKELSWG